MKTLLVFFALLVGAVVVAMPLAIGAFAWFAKIFPDRPALPAGAAEAASQLATSTQPTGFGAWLTTLIPTNPIAAAANGAMLPLIIFALLFALAVAQSPVTTRDTLRGFFKA